MAETFAWLDEREAWFFEAYLERDSLRHVVDALRAESEWPLARDTIYRWLKDDEARWARWQECVELQGHFSRDDAMQIAMNSEQATANRDRLRFEAKRWSAEVQNRQAYGKRPDVQIAIGVGDDWLKALSIDGTSTTRALAGMEGQHPSVDSPVRALPKGSTEDEGLA